MKIRIRGATPIKALRTPIAKEDAVMSSSVFTPPADPFDLIRVPKPALDGFFWEDIVFVPTQPRAPCLQKKRNARLGRLGFHLTIAALMVGALRLSITSAPEPAASLTLAQALGEPETTGSIQPALRPTFAG